MSRRGAVLIGVDRVQDSSMAVLQSAAAGAVKVGEWLKDEQGYQVEVVTDQKEAVTVERIKEAIALFASEQRRFDFLLVYFSGHGMEVNDDEHWMLSDAPQDPDAAINLYAASKLAQRSGIATVVFVSDCCRTLPGNPRWSSLGGSKLFPNLGFREVPTKVDVFKAAGVGEPAFEVELVAGESRQSVLTEALLSAFEEPQPDMVRRVDDKLVVPNRKLEGYLGQRVRQLLRSVNKSLIQTVVCDVPSGDDAYIATASREPLPGESATVPGLEYFESALVDVGKGAALSQGEGAHLQAAQLVVDRTCYPVVDESWLSHMLKSALVNALPNAAGGPVKATFIVRGAEVADMYCAQFRDFGVKALDDATGPYQAVFADCADDLESVLVAVRFADGRCALLPYYRHYVAHLSLDERGLHSVYYAPLPAHPKADAFADLLKKDTAFFRHYVQQVSLYRDFWPGDLAETTRLAHLCIELQAFSPSFSLYLAYGLSAACQSSWLQEVQARTLRELGSAPLDIALLSLDTLPTKGTACPLISRGWNLLAVADVELHPVLDQAQRHLCQSLWTLFDTPIGVDVFEAAKKGELM